MPPRTPLSHPPADVVSAGRNSGIDLLRVVGVTAVVVGHAAAGHVVTQWIYPWHVPLFFFLSGYFWKRGRTVLAELRSRSQSLLVPYAFWLALGLSVLIAAGLITPGGILTVLRGGTGARGPFAAYWFVTALFFVCIVARLLERLPAWVAWTVAVAGTAATYIVPMADFPLALGQVFPGLLFFLFGTLARRLALPWWAAALLLAGCIIAIASLPLAAFDMKALRLGTPVVGVLLAVAIAWASTTLFGHVRATWATTAATAGIAVVLFHTLVLSGAAAIGLPTLVQVLAVLSISWAVSISLQWTPLSHIAVGVRRRRRTDGRTSRL